MQPYESLSISDLETVDRIRAASRQMVRRLGFMPRTLAGTDLSASAVHAIIELGEGSARTAQDLTTLLGLEKSTVSRLLKPLVQRNLIREERDAQDRRAKCLVLTAEGLALFHQVTAYGRQQVQGALASQDPEGHRLILQGLEHYAEALGHEPKHGVGAAFRIEEGYQPALLGHLVSWHAAYYHRHHGFSWAFEEKVAREACDFLGRLGAVENQTFSAVARGQLIGTVSVDGQDLGAGLAHLRWFIVDPAWAGKGVGQALMEAVMAFVRAQQFRACHLWTFAGLEAARKLYERHGFELAEQHYGAQWGSEVLEQEFVWTP